MVWLSPPGDPHRTPVSLVFRVADCRAVYGELRETGVAFLTPPHRGRLACCYFES